MKKALYLILISLAACTQLLAQEKSPVLFDYGNNSVSASEFLRMYTKNLNNKEPDFSKSALNEYLNLYSLFKMKVAEAKSLKVDTLPNIEQEIATYKKQLSNTYLTNREVTTGLVKEAYERKKKDVEVAHIMIGLTPNTEDTMTQYKLADSIYKAIKAGKISFEDAAKRYSTDKQSGENKGYIGFMTAMQIVYPFETMAYQTPKDKISVPFRTIYGYHILKKISERPARGEIQVAQIMTLVRKSEGDEGIKRAKEKIQKALAELKKGAEFDKVAAEYNEDQYTKNTSGVMPVFGIGKMVPNYENAAFALKKPGDFSEIVETSNGFHIISLMKKIPLKPFEEEQRTLAKLIERDGRIKVAQEQFLAELKQRMGYKEDIASLNELINAIPDSSLRDGSFDPALYQRMTKKLFSLNETSMNQADFATYLKEYTKGRIFGTKSSSLTSLFRSYTEKVLMDNEEQNLEENNPEYKNLLQEYREGILIFELTDQMVWSKAPKDSVGLKNYFEKNRSKYLWKPSVKGQIYKAKDENYIKEVVKALNGPKKLTPLELVKAVNGDGPQDKVSLEEGTFEQDRFSFKTPFKKGTYMPYFKNNDGSYSLLFIDQVNNEQTQKSFDEARGYCISDYQDQLEKQWHSRLREKYPVKVNDQVFKGLVK